MRKLAAVLLLSMFLPALLAQPEMDMSRGASPVSDSGFENVGSFAAGLPFTLTYTIANSGTADLTIATPVAAPISPTNCQVTVSTQPASLVTPSSTTTFALTVTPISGGFFSCQPSIGNNDSNENPYNWFISGTGLGPAMSLIRAGAILNGATDNLPNGAPAFAQSYTYTISNLGNQALNLVTPLGAPGGLINCAAAITQQPVSPVPASSNVQFTVSITPAALGAFSCLVSIGNDDPGKNPFTFTMSGNATSPAPEMEMRRGVIAIVDAGTHFIGGQWGTGVASTLTLAILNNGTAALNVTTPVSAPTALTNCAASIATQPAASVAAGASTTLVLSFTPTAGGAFSFQVSIASDDADENPYNFTVSGNATAGVTPDVDVQRSMVSIPDGGTDNAGTIASGSATSFTYALRNTGMGQLSFLDLAAPGSTMNCSATIFQQPLSPLAPTQFSNFIVQITPAAPGAFSCVITISNNDVGESPYDFTLGGTAAASIPEIALSRGTTQIVDGGFDNVGTQPFGAPINLTYTISNTGTGPLTLTLPIAAPTAVINCTAVISQQPAGATVAAASSATFVVQITAAAAGGFNCQISIANDDSDENPCNWTLSGFAAAGPEIEVQRPAGTSIPDGGLHDLGQAPAGAASTFTFTITNSGSANLTLGGAPLVQVSSALNCTASVTAMPASVVAAAGTTTFEVSVTPSTAGTFGFVLSIPNNDSDESVYNFSCAGNTGGGGGGGGGSSDESGCTSGERGAGWLALAALGALALLPARRRFQTTSQ